MHVEATTCLRAVCAGPHAQCPGLRADESALPLPSFEQGLLLSRKGEMTRPSLSLLRVHHPRVSTQPLGSRRVWELGQVHGCCLTPRPPCTWGWSLSTAGIQTPGLPAFSLQGLLVPWLQRPKLWWGAQQPVVTQYRHAQ